MLDVSRASGGHGGRVVGRYRGHGTEATAWGARHGLDAFFRSVFGGTDRFAGRREDSAAVSVGEGRQDVSVGRAG